MVVKNILRMATGAPLLSYEEGEKPVIISLGKRRGILRYKGFLLTGILPAFLKWFSEWRMVRRYS